MSLLTTFLHLIKPDASENYSVDVWNTNSDIIDDNIAYIRYYDRTDIQITPQSDFTFEVTNGYAKITGYSGNSENVVIPYKYSVYDSQLDEYTEYDVNEIGFGAFDNNTNITSVIIPKSVTTISGHAFDGCTNLVEVSIPESVTSVWGNAFEGCTSLESITIPKNLTDIHDYAFKNCTHLKNISIPDGTTSVFPYVFENCTSLERITIPKGAATISGCAFKGCANLKEIIIPDSVRYIGYTSAGIEYRPFEGCNNLMIICTQDSYAETYAIEHDIPYRYDITDPVDLSDYYNKTEIDTMISQSGGGADVSGKEDSANKGQANGYAPLDQNAKIPDEYLYGKTIKQYGVRYNGGSSTARTRLGDAVGLVANAEAGEILGVVNDFDNIYPWSDMKLCNVDSSGNIKAFIGDPAFKRDNTTKLSGTGSDLTYTIPSKPESITGITVDGTALDEQTDYTYNASTGAVTFTSEPSLGSDNIVIVHSVYDVMVRIPKFYYKRVQTGNEEEIWICGAPMPGYSLHPLFTDNGQEVSQVFIGAYIANSVTENGTDVLKSMSNSSPVTYLYRSVYRTRARAKGSVWGILDISAISAIQMLYLVEYANTAAQAMLGCGVSNMTYTNKHKQLIEDSNTNTFTLATVFADLYRVGEAIGIGTSQGSAILANNRRIISITATAQDPNISEIVFDGEAVESLTTNCMIWNTVSFSGECDELNGKSGYIGENGRKAVSYRGIENVFGNAAQYIDGVNILDQVAYISNDFTHYADDTWTGSYKALSYTNASSNGYVSKQGYDPNYPWAMFPVGSSGSAITHYSDNYTQDTGKRYLSFGGGWKYDTENGLFCFGCNVAFASRSNFGSTRLLVKKP